MKEYKYTYQDWIEGKLESKQLKGLYFNQDINFEDYILILNDQDQAYLKRLTDALECLKEDFKRVYKKTLVSDYYLNFYIQMYTKLVNKFSESDQGKIASFTAIFPSEDGREELTINQVVEYLSFDIKHYESRSELTRSIRGAEHELTQFNFITNSNFLKWLYWLQEQEKSDRSQPEINTLSRSASVIIEEAPKVLKRNHISYNWLNDTTTELPELYQLLINNNLIHSDTKLEQIKAAFTEQPLHTIQPIKWHDNNASELLYFILQLQGSDGSIIEKEKQTNYKRLQACFVKPDGKPFTENFRQAKQNLKQYGLSPKSQEIIDNIIKQFY